MNIITSQLTIVFEPPFYKAIFERKSANQYEVAQVTLGTSEPKTPAIIQLVMKNWRNIHFFRKDSYSSRIAIVKHVNPKRRQRLANKAMTHNTSTKAQSALKEQFEAAKQQRKHLTVTERNRCQQRHYLQKKAKRIEKHKGH